jgi:conserved repeat domain
MMTRMKSYSLVAALLALVATACSDTATSDLTGLRASSNTAPTSADLQLSGSSSKGTPTGGATFTYTFQVKWASGGEADNNVFVDTLPAGVGFNFAWVNAISSAGSCTEQAMVVTCPLPNLDKTSIYQPLVIINVNAPPTVGTFSNTGILVSGTPDPQLANNRSTVTMQVKTPLAPCPELVGQTVYNGFMAFGSVDSFGIFEQFGFQSNGVNYYVVTNYFDGTQPLTNVINLDCKSPTPAQFVNNFFNVVGTLDGSTITTSNGITWQVLHASVIQVFPHKDAF